MSKDQSWIALIENRISIRIFEYVENIDLSKLSDFIMHTSLRVKTPIRFKIIQSQIESNISRKLGTYGFIQGANTFIAGIVDTDHTSPVEFGFLMEEIVLFATGLGFGTCWLGGTFNRNQFDSNLDLDKNESIGVLIALGIKKDNQSLIDKVVRFSAKSNHRKPWSELFFEYNLDTPLDKNRIGKYEKVLEMVRIAPSASNKQPWRIIKDDQNYHFFLSRTPGYNVMSFDLQMNDMGIAMCHFELSASELGLNGNWIKTELHNEFSGFEYCLSWEDISS